MKKTYLRIAALLLCALLLFAACGGSEEETPAAEPQTEVAEAPAAETPAQPAEEVETEPAAAVEAVEEAAAVEEVEAVEETAEEEEEKELRTDFALDAAPASEGTLVGSIESDKYHHPECRWVDEILPENETWFADEADAKSQGYTACGTCY